MATRRDDYLLRMIEQLRQFVAEALRRRERGQLDLALVMLMQAQEKLFARPTGEFIGLPLEEQLRLLTLDEPPESAREKALAYATVLKEAGKLYQARNQDDLARSARQLALHVTLLTAAGNPPAQRGPLLADAESLLRELRADELHAPVKELATALGLG